MKNKTEIAGWEYSGKEKIAGGLSATNYKQKIPYTEEYMALTVITKEEKSAFNGKITENVVAATCVTVSGPDPKVAARKIKAREYSKRCYNKKKNKKKIQDEMDSYNSQAVRNLKENE